MCVCVCVCLCVSSTYGILSIALQLWNCKCIWLQSSWPCPSKGQTRMLPMYVCVCVCVCVWGVAQPNVKHRDRSILWISILFQTSLVLIGARAPNWDCSKMMSLLWGWRGGIQPNRSVAKRPLRFEWCSQVNQPDYAPHPNLWRDLECLQTFHQKFLQVLGNV